MDGGITNALGDSYTCTCGRERKIHELCTAARKSKEMLGKSTDFKGRQWSLRTPYIAFFSADVLALLVSTSSDEF
jgi:hypothetical protein